MQQVILIHPEAPPKPRSGEPCNGCGVCCLAEPCPMGSVLSRRIRGACRLLQWSPTDRRYRCGVLADPMTLWPWLPRAAAPLVRRIAARWISAARGCDSDAVTLA